MSQMDAIADAIAEAGLDPYDQLYGYLRTGEERYITRNRNARERIRQTDRRTIKKYINYLKDKR